MGNPHKRKKARILEALKKAQVVESAENIFVEPITQEVQEVVLQEETVEVKTTKKKKTV